MLVPDITVYDALKSIMSEDKARNLVAGIKKQVAEEIEIQQTGLATKEDISKLDKRIAELDLKITEVKAEMIKWMFAFVMGALVINIVALTAAFFALANILKR